MLKFRETHYVPAGVYFKKWRLHPFTYLPNIYIHNFINDDMVTPHDHPFDFVALTLWGRAEEILYKVDNSTQDRAYESKRRKVGIGSLRKYLAEDVHRFVNVRNLWTICLIIRRRRVWGFWTNHGWVPHTEFIRK